MKEDTRAILNANPIPPDGDTAEAPFAATTDADAIADVFRPGENCQRIATARRAAVLVDGENYFRAVHSAMRRARRSIMIVGWDLHSEVRLVRSGRAHDLPLRLGPFLDTLARWREGLVIYLLSWDFAMIYALEREFFPRYKFTWRTHDRIHFRLDGEHPIGASQHQKIVVVDDAVAFAGGFDLSQWRWDTAAHRPDDDRRKDPSGNVYPPFHDVQMMVDGPAAEALGAVVKDRWARACGKSPGVDQGIAIGDPWPPDIAPDFRDVPVAVARTLPAHRDYPEIREVERLYMDSIAAARRTIYIENQYLSAYRIGEAIRQRLETPSGPEVVIVLPENTGGWLEQHTMDVLRGRLLEKLRAADRHHRLRVYYPRVGTDPHTSLMVHAKVMVIDDQFLRVGSSNLSNRSLGLDSECDLAIAAAPETPTALAIAGFRDRLLAEHLGVSPKDVAESHASTGSIGSAVESLRGGARTLLPMDASVPEAIDRWVPDAELLDPERPIAPEALLDTFVGPEQRHGAFRQSIKVLALIAGLVVSAAIWQWGPADGWIDANRVLAAAQWLADRPMAPLSVPAVFVLGGLVSFPVTLMIIATVGIFGPWLGVVYAVVGAQASAMTLFGLGRWLGREGVRRYAGSLINRLSRKLSENAIRAVITVRIVPVAPFSVINVIAGATEIRWRDFAVGTFIGQLPGTLIAAIVADRLVDALRRADLAGIAMLAAAVVGAMLLLAGLRRRLHGDQGPDGRGDG